MKTIIASAFDSNYLPRAIALYDSAAAALPNAEFQYLCLDAAARDALNKLALPRMHAVLVDDIGDAELMATRKSRSAGEFAFTSKSAWLDYLVRSEATQEGDVLVFADADILFYPAARSYFERLPAFSIAIAPHGFTKDAQHRAAQFGRYNAGMVLFRIDDASRACIADWRRDTIEWCFARTENGKFADQMYLDAWPARYAGVYEIRTEAMNVGPWNLATKKISLTKTKEFTIDGAPLYSYHFHGFKVCLDSHKKVRPILVGVSANAAPLYTDYTAAIARAYERLLSVDPSWNKGFAPCPSLLKRIKWAIRRIGGSLYEKTATDICNRRTRLHRQRTGGRAR
jgi:hypothetical protein